MYFPLLGCSIWAPFFMKYLYPFRYFKSKNLNMILAKKIFILIFLLLNCFVDILSTESYAYSSLFLKQLKICFETRNEDKCKEIILLTERMQLREYYMGNLKCQTSILGLQTELIRNIYFDREKDNVSGKTIPSLIKNC